jgi:hypothetical protein
VRHVRGILIILFLASGVQASELVLGSVPIPLGKPVGPVVASLQETFAVRVIEGGWEARSRDSTDHDMPLVAFSAKDGLIGSVSFIWGPGTAPSSVELFRQLTSALPPDSGCTIENVTRPFEGGTVRTLIFQCGTLTVDVRTGVWPAGSNASIAIRQE